MCFWTVTNSTPILSKSHHPPSCSNQKQVLSTVTFNIYPYCDPLWPLPVAACVCVCLFHVLYLLFIKRLCFVFQFVGSSFPFKAVSSWVGPTYQTDFIALTSKSKQTVLVLPWPQVSQRSLPLLTAPTSFQVPDYSTLYISPTQQPTDTALVKTTRMFLIAKPKGLSVDNVWLSQSYWTSLLIRNC